MKREAHRESNNEMRILPGSEEVAVMLRLGKQAKLRMLDGSRRWISAHR